MGKVDVRTVQAYARQQRDQRRRNASRYPCKVSTAVDIDMLDMLDTLRQTQLPDCTRSEVIRILLLLALSTLQQA